MCPSLVPCDSNNFQKQVKLKEMFINMASTDRKAFEWLSFELHKLMSGIFFNLYVYSCIVIWAPKLGEYDYPKSIPFINFETFNLIRTVACLPQFTGGTALRPAWNWNFGRALIIIFRGTRCRCDDQTLLRVGRLCETLTTCQLESSL